MIVDLYLVYSFIKRLAMPFKKWDAYKLGIIDDKGNILKKRKEFTTPQERKAFGVFDLMILKLKKLLAKVPGGSTRIASYAAALYLIKEWNHFSDSSMLNESVSEVDINESLDLFLERYFYYTTLAEVVNQKIKEDGEGGGMAAGAAPTNSVGAGAIAGFGKEPPVSKAAQKRYTNSNSMIRRKMPILAVKEANIPNMNDLLSGEPGAGGMIGVPPSGSAVFKPKSDRSNAERGIRKIKYPTQTN